MENFIYTFQIEPDICDELMQYHKENNEYKSIGTYSNNTVNKDIKESIDVSFFNNSSNPTIKSYFKKLQNGYEKYVDKYNIHHLRITAEQSHNIQYYPAAGGFKQWHWERHTDSHRRQLVYMTYLNDVTDGGGTEWLYQKTKLDARKGLSVIWPADFAWTHRGIVSPTQEKWIATGWFSYI